MCNLRSASVTEQHNKNQVHPQNDASFHDMQMLWYCSHKSHILVSRDYTRMCRLAALAMIPARPSCGLSSLVCTPPQPGNNAIQNQ